jgi:hypothetical protein
MFRRILEKGLNESCHDPWSELCEVLGFMRKPWGHRMGPIFGGMMLSGERAMEIIESGGDGL